MFIVHVVLTAVEIVSTVVYVLYLRMVIRHRNEEPFSGSFFQLTIPLGFADIWSLVSIYFVAKLPTWGYFHSFFTANNGQPWLAEYVGVTWVYFVPIQLIGIFLLAINRWTAVKYPLMYKALWLTWQKRVTALQLLLPLLLCVLGSVVVSADGKYAYVVCLDLPHQCDNGTDFQTRIRGGILSNEDGPDVYRFSKQTGKENGKTTVTLNVNQVTTTAQNPQYHSFVLAVYPFFLLIVTAIIVANMATVYELVKHRNRDTVQSFQNAEEEAADRATERRLTLASMLVFTLMMMNLICIAFTSTEHPKQPMRLYENHLVMIIFDCFQYMNPYIILACSTLARERFLQMLGLKKV